MNRLLSQFTVAATAFLAATTALGQGATAPASAPSAKAGDAPRVAAPTDASAAGQTATTGHDYGAEREAIWNSAEMVDARAWLAERSRVSKRFGPQEEKNYIAWLQRKSPEDLKKWLAWFKTRRAGLAESDAVARAARQAAVDHALTRQQQVQQSYANINQGQTEGAIAAREKLQAEQVVGRKGTSLRDYYDTARAQIVDADAANYSWVFPSYGKYMQWAAAASLPGDLPRGDPRNFSKEGGSSTPAIDAAIRLDANSAINAAAAGVPPAGGAPAAGAGAGGAPAGGAGSP